MTGTPFLDVAGRRRFPDFDEPDLGVLAKAARSPKRMPYGGVVAVDWKDPGGDELVFGAVGAVQHIAGEPWLVRAVIRGSTAGPPVLARVAVEHFRDLGREVTGAILRDLRLGEIRDRALIRLRERGTNLAAMSFVPESWRTAAREAGEKAGRGRIAVGPRGAYPAEHYWHIAERYLALVATGRRDVLNALSEEESKRLGEPIGRERIRDWVRKATRLGFLAPGQPGTVGRRPGTNYERERQLLALDQLEGESDAS